MSRSNYALLIFAFVLTVATIVFNAIVVFIHMKHKQSKFFDVLKYIILVDLIYLILLFCLVCSTSCAAKEDSEVYSHVVVTTHSGELIYDYEGQCQIIHIHDADNRILKIIEEDGTVQKVNINGSTVCLIK